MKDYLGTITWVIIGGIVVAFIYRAVTHPGCQEQGSWRRAAQS